MKTNFEYLAKILKDDAIDTWTLREQEEINKLDLTKILTGITSGEPNPNIIQGFVQNFIEDFNIY